MTEEDLVKAAEKILGRPPTDKDEPLESLRELTAEEKSDEGILEEPSPEPLSPKSPKSKKKKRS